MTRIHSRILLTISALLISWISCSESLAWHPLTNSRYAQTFPTRAYFLLQAKESQDEDEYSVDSPISRMDQLQSAQRGDGRNSVMSIGSQLLDAAAAVTQQSCSLLGVKSVGVDYGLVRTGLAATVGYNPKALDILEDLNNTQVCHEIIRQCQSERASQIIVGLPLHKNGTEAEQTLLTRIFAMELATVALQKLGPKVPVYMWDERYTSKEAVARAHSQNPDRYLYGTLDAEAACIILEHFYNENGKGAQQVRLSKNVEEECLLLWDNILAEEEQKAKAAMESRLKDSATRRKEAMERARVLEEEMKKDGILGESRKKKKKKKKKREKRGPWLVPGEE